MHLATVVVYVSSIVWIFPIFRQYNTRMFYFFLVLGLSDPINIFSLWALNTKPGFVHSIAALLLFYSLNFRDNQKLKMSHTDILVGILFLSLAFFLNELFYLTFLIHLLILSRIIQIIVVDIHKKSELNIFYLVLIFYEISIVMNLFILLSRTERGMLLFFITLTFQILIAIFFTIFKENNPRLLLKLKS